MLQTRTDADEKVVKHEARLVAQGFSQQPSVDFEETFAPVGRLASLRILLTVGALHDLVIRQADVEGAYLNAPLTQEIYIEIPQGYVQSRPSATVLRKLKALYGLKQSGREWWIALGDALTELSFARCENEWGMYVRKDDQGTHVLVLVYVLSHTSNDLIQIGRASCRERVYATV